MFMNLTRRIGPATDFYSSLHQLNRLLESNAPASTWTPAADVSEDAAGIRIVLELPGVKPEEIQVTLENRMLAIRGEKKNYGNFERSFSLPSTVNVEGIEAQAEHGVLTLMLPKAEQAKPRQIPVKA